MRTRYAATLASVVLVLGAALTACSGDDSVGEVPATVGRHGIRHG